MHMAELCCSPQNIRVLVLLYLYLYACLLRGAPCHMHACTLIKLESAPAVHTSCGSLDVLCGAFRVCLPEQGHFAWLMGCCEYLEAAQCALGRQAF